MGTGIVIDQKLMDEALRLSGARTKRRVIEEALRFFIRVKREERIRAARGKLRWVAPDDRV